MKASYSLIAAMMAFLFVSQVYAEKKIATPNFAWANGMLYNAAKTTNYSPSEGSKNTLCVFEGLKGQRAVAEAAPGDVNYQNGRWQVVIIEFTPEGKKTFDVNGDGFSEFEVTSWDMLQHYMNDHGYFKVVGQAQSFDAPLMRPKGLEAPEKKAEKASLNK